MTPAIEHPILHTRWTQRKPTALCRDDKCPWKHVGVTLVATKNAADRHVEATGHEVTISLEQTMAVKRR